MSPTEIEACLRGCELFTALTSSALGVLVARAELHEAEGGVSLMSQGEAGTDLFVLVEGELEAVQCLPDGAEATLDRIRPGSLVGEMQALAGGVRTATVRAVGASRLLRLPEEALQLAAREHPALVEAIGHSVRGRLRRLHLRAALHSHYGAVEPGLIEAVEAAVEWRDLDRGEALFREGDRGDHIAFLLAGRLRVERSAGASREVVGEVLPGETVGESALLPDSRRGATVLAARSSELAILNVASFRAVARAHPTLLWRALEVMARRQRTGAPPQLTAHTVTLLPLHGGVDVAETLETLCASLPADLSHVVVTRQDAARRLGLGAAEAMEGWDDLSLRLSLWSRQLEVSYELVIYCVDALDHPWATWCVEEADELLMVAPAHTDPRPSPAERQLVAAVGGPGAVPITLLLYQRTSDLPRGTDRWLAPRHVDLVLHARRGHRGDHARLGRFLTRRAIGVVISGGAAHSFAGLGALRALEEVGVPVDAVGGVSMGALIAAAHARGLSAAENLADCMELMKVRPDFTLPVVSLISAKGFARSLRERFGARRVEDLWLPAYFLSANLTRAQQRLGARGDIVETLRASNAAPGLFPPVIIDGDLHVDGVLMNNVPVPEMVTLVRGGPVIVVDVSPTVEFGSVDAPADGLSGWRVAKDWLLRRGDDRNMPSLVHLLLRSQVLHHADRVDEDRALAALALVPDLRGFLLVQHHRGREIAAAGYQQALEPVRAWWAGVERR